MGACRSKLTDVKESSKSKGKSASKAKKGKGKQKGKVEEATQSGSSITSSSRHHLEPLKEFIHWSDIKVTASTTEEAIIGVGSFGAVVRATWTVRRPDGTIQQEAEVAVKVLTRTSAQATSEEAYKTICQRAMDEVVLLKEAEKAIGSAERLVKAYGVAKGKLPRDLTTLFKFAEEDEGVGIVMRYEGGGSLETLLHSRKARKRPPMPLREKLYLLKGIAHSLAELHSVGIVHADIKPENVLLSHHKPPLVRLADFGMSILQDVPLGQSSLTSTSHMRGTPVYCAPEMLVNPYGEFDGTVAKSSRKTDMYSFAMLAWEVLAQQRPFSELKSEGQLCSRVHKNYRPNINSLPPSTPLDVVGMIELCWDRDRAVRLSAIECLAILHYQYDLDSGKRFDVFLSHAPSARPFLSHVTHILAQRGYRIWFDRSSGTHNGGAITADEHSEPNSVGVVSVTDINHSDKNAFTPVPSNNSVILTPAFTLDSVQLYDDSTKPLPQFGLYSISTDTVAGPVDAPFSTPSSSLQREVVKPSSRECLAKCRVVIICLTREYVKNEACMNELRMATKCSNPRPVMLLLLDDDPDEWAIGELLELCPLETTPLTDLRQAMKDARHWTTTEEGPDIRAMNKLSRALNPLTAFISTHSLTTPPHSAGSGVGVSTRMSSREIERSMIESITET